MGLTTSTPELPEDPTRRVYESCGITKLPFDYPLEVPGERSEAWIVGWWSEMQLVHPEVPYEVVWSPPTAERSYELASSGTSWCSKSNRFDSLSPLTRLIVEMAISDMRKTPERLECFEWHTGCNIEVWVMPGARTVRIQYTPRNGKFMALYTYVHLTASLEFASYEYYANLW